MASDRVCIFPHSRWIPYTYAGIFVTYIAQLLVLIKLYVSFIQPLFVKY